MQLQFSIFLYFSVMQLQFQFFSELFSYAATVFFLPELILHKYSVEGMVQVGVAAGTDSLRSLKHEKTTTTTTLTNSL